MTMPGRSYQAPNAVPYRFSINGQDRSDEIFEGSTTALYWEYDSRIGRRWNVDPVLKEYESPYMCFSGNPILYCDPKGDDAENYSENRKEKRVVAKYKKIFEKFKALHPKKTDQEIHKELAITYYHKSWMWVKSKRNDEARWNNNGNYKNEYITVELYLYHYPSHNDTKEVETERTTSITKNITATQGLSGGDVNFEGRKYHSLDSYKIPDDVKGKFTITPTITTGPSTQEGVVVQSSLPYNTINSNMMFKFFRDISYAGLKLGSFELVNSSVAQTLGPINGVDINGRYIFILRNITALGSGTSPASISGSSGMTITYEVKTIESNRNKAPSFEPRPFTSPINGNLRRDKEGQFKSRYNYFGDL